ncbi:hypothetical protein ESCO_006780 [Escovopsis weberi]|uniref:Chromo domain-containing protein n=1 Tax=Escovopsis weberi TaxID=150374 RepID=A0A0M8N751_ESCWE|nr:hypothetical protein ESCO_006780 [Escovopsis weberi]
MRGRNRKREDYDKPDDDTVDEEQTESDNNNNSNKNDHSSDRASIEVFKVESPEPESPVKKRKTKEVDETSLENDTRIPDKFVSHRVFEHLSQTEIEVKWKDAPNSWEVEFHLQKRWPQMLYAYWRSNGGRQKATKLEDFHIFKVLKHRPVQKRYLVQWVGYSESPADVTWEPEKLVYDTAPHLLAEFQTREAESKAIKKAIAAAPKKHELPLKRGTARKTGKSSSKKSRFH